MKSLLLVGLLFLGACANTMGAYYGAVSTAATVTQTALALLDKYDADTQASIRAKATTDAAGAKAALDAYLPKYNKARKAIDSTVAAVTIASAAAPVVSAAVDKNKQIAGWVAKLLALAADVTAALSDLGIKVPSGLVGAK